MAILIRQASRYLRNASLCYELAAAIREDKASAMIRLGDHYSELADALVMQSQGASSGENDLNPVCPNCGSDMRPAEPDIEVLLDRLKYRCACGEALTCRISKKASS
jgi:hypothetical protein